MEIVRAICDAYARGDYETALASLDPEIELVGPPDISAGDAPFLGRDQVRQGVASFLAPGDDYRYEDRDVTDCGDEVLVEGFQRARGKASGVEVAEPFYSVWTVRQGRVIRLRMFRDVLVIGRATGAGLTSVASFDMEWANLLTLSSGQVIREQPFFDHAEARAEVELSE